MSWTRQTRVGVGEWHRLACVCLPDGILKATQQQRGLSLRLSVCYEGRYEFEPSVLREDVSFPTSFFLAFSML